VLRIPVCLNSLDHYQQPGKDPIMFPTGTLLSNMPDVVHGGFKVVGDTSLKAFSVYVVDRNRPLYDWAK
jgi:hypothetical protein